MEVITVAVWPPCAPVSLKSGNEVQGSKKNKQEEDVILLPPPRSTTLPLKSVSSPPYAVHGDVQQFTAAGEAPLLEFLCVIRFVLVFFPTRSILVIFPSGQATMANPSYAR
ncbi:hypothetical protein P8452_13023 [Trifolium repens]|nr:hypothetical protein QL285_008280 [Trifolium repens]WJX23839.1 hypothetical protein P8452_13023 [Trifolium repens]